MRAHNSMKKKTQQLFNHSYKYIVIHSHHHLHAVIQVLEIISFLCDFMLILLLPNLMEFINGDLFPSLKIF